jgi:hypothetical protein
MRFKKSSRRGSANLKLDVGLGVSLLLALVVVLCFDWLKPKTTEETQPPVKPTTVPEPPPPAPRPLAIGVTPAYPEFDDMGMLLKKMGEGYKYHAFPLEELGDMKKIAEYNIIFLTCSGICDKWVKKRLGQAERDGMIKVISDQELIKQACDNLRTFVENGGTLYASDLHYNLLADAFREFAYDRNEDSAGKIQKVAAEVTDPGLKELIGGELSLQFDQRGWRPAAFRGESVVTYLQGSYQTLSGEEKSSPLLVKFRVKDGVVIFTSFHNEKVNSEIETKLLQYLVFTAMTARDEAKASDTIAEGGFTPAKKNLFSASKSQPPVTRTHHLSKAGQLKFVLVFPSVGAKLRLTVEGPDGKQLTREGSSTITIDVTQAAAGDWKYTVTLVELPSESFTYKVIVGEK